MFSSIFEEKKLLKSLKKTLSIEICVEYHQNNKHSVENQNGKIMPFV